MLVSLRLLGERRLAPSQNPRRAPRRQLFRLPAPRSWSSRVLDWVLSVPPQPGELRSPAWVVTGLVSTLLPEVTRMWE